jgi:hypothetical protein
MVAGTMQKGKLMGSGVSVQVAMVRPVLRVPWTARQIRHWGQVDRGSRMPPSAVRAALRIAERA